MGRTACRSEVPSPTLRDVAREARVSIMTVSRVINDVPGVGPITALRVLAAIEKLGYHPDFAARALRGRSSRTIALMVADVSNPFYSVTLRAD